MSVFCASTDALVSSALLALGVPENIDINPVGRLGVQRDCCAAVAIAVAYVTDCQARMTVRLQRVKGTRPHAESAQ